MKTVKATIVYPIDIEIQVPDNASTDEIWTELIKESDKKIKETEIAPVVYKCSEPINKKEQLIEKRTDSQEEWFQIILQKLQQAKETLDPIMSTLAVIKPRAHPEIIVMAHHNLTQAIEYLISSVSQTKDFLIQETWIMKSNDEK